MQDLYISISLD